MKRFLLLATFLLAVSCTTVPCKQCPPENVYLLVEPGVPVSVPKGFLDNPDNYWTEEELKKLLREKGESI